jgi:hypothetical protein
MAMRLAGWVFGAVLVVVGGGRASAQVGMVPPCGLMSQAVAAGINGGAVEAGREQDMPGVAKSCSFAGDGNNGQVAIAESAPTMGGMTTAQIFKLGETTPPSPGTTVTVLSGLGDGAYFITTGPNFDVWVLKGQVMLDVNAVPPQGPHPGLEAAMVAAARGALAGM